MARSTRQEWAERVRRWRSSGQTAGEFARHEGLNANTLRWWASRLKLEPKARPAFVEVALPRAAESEASIELVVRDARIRVRPGFDEALLRRVLAVLESR